MTNQKLPVIGITCNKIRKTEDRPHQDGQNVTYIQALAQSGAAPLMVPNLQDDHLRTVYDLCAGLLLAGGGDIEPHHYGEERRQAIKGVSRSRDRAELALTRWAIAEGKPLLAICRGMQVLNVALGGSLYQDIASQVPGSNRHDWHGGYSRQHTPHSVALTSDSFLTRLLGTTSLMVNSLHHQAVKGVAPNVVVVGRSPDGIVEAVEVSEHPFVIAVQWHPEELVRTQSHARQLFDAFVQASIRGRGAI